MILIGTVGYIPFFSLNLGITKSESYGTLAFYNHCFDTGDINMTSVEKDAYSVYSITGYNRNIAGSNYPLQFYLRIA